MEQHTTLSPREMLRTCCDWLMQQYIHPGMFRCMENGRQMNEWYMFFYPVRTLLLGDRLLNEPKYTETALTVVEAYLAEQLPNGAFTSNYRAQPTETLTKEQFEQILRAGKVNVADNGSNLLAVTQAAAQAQPHQRRRYLQAVQRWFDNWLAIWALPEGGYGNGIWGGHKINTPYTCAMATSAAALCAYAQASGDAHYARLASRSMAYQCSQWLEQEGVPVNMDCYPMPRQTRLVDYGHSFYLLEALCWTHKVTEDLSLKRLIEKRLTQWIFGREGLLSQWSGSWFTFSTLYWIPKDGQLPSSRQKGIRLGWELAKSNGILHAFLYYLRHVDDDSRLREVVDRGLGFLTTPAKARMSGVMSDPEESYGAFAVQSTGFAGLSLAEAIEPDIVFNLSPGVTNTDTPGKS